MYHSWRLPLALLGLCFTAYWPALDNGFISDDYVFLERAETWAQDFGYLFTIPPENFRMTTYAAFRLLKGIFGYCPQFFYMFTILTHFVNCLLLWKVISLITGSLRTATLAAVLFATVQNPQEAVMWLGGMHEALLGFFVLATLLLWIRGKFLWSVLAYSVALISKESAPLVLLFIPLVEFCRTGKALPRREYSYFLLPTLIFTGLFLHTAPTNSLIVHGFYAFGPHAIEVFGKSLHRLAFPWFYLAVILTLRHQRSWPRNAVGATLAWMALGLLPYLFLTYQDHLPSRQLYLPSMGLVTALALLMEARDRIRLQRMFVIVFVAVNIGYLWFVKDVQFERRGAPTRELVEELRSRSPKPLLITDFPGNPWTAKLTARLVRGWKPELILVNELEKTCRDCVKLRWNPKTQKYVNFWDGPTTRILPQGSQWPIALTRSVRCGVVHTSFQLSAILHR